MRKRPGEEWPGIERFILFVRSDGEWPWCGAILRPRAAVGVGAGKHTGWCEPCLRSAFWRPVGIRHATCYSPFDICTLTPLVQSGAPPHRR